MRPRGKVLRDGPSQRPPLADPWSARQVVVVRRRRGSRHRHRGRRGTVITTPRLRKLPLDIVQFCRKKLDNVHPALLKPLRASLNPFSQFDFGVFSALPNARHWQTKKADQ